MFAQNTEGEVGPDEDGLVIDEVSPSEDDCFVEAVVHSKSESCYFYTHESRWFKCSAGDPSHGIDPGEEYSQFGALQSKGNYLRGSVNMQQSKLSTCWYVLLTIRLGEIEDIVAQHRQRNCAPQLPDNAQLLAACDQQTSKASHCISHSKADALDSLEGPISKMSSSAEAAPTPLPATSVISGIVPNSNSDPSHLQFYTPPVSRTKQVWYSEHGR